MSFGPTSCAYEQIAVRFRPRLGAEHTMASLAALLTLTGLKEFHAMPRETCAVVMMSDKHESIDELNDLIVELLAPYAWGREVITDIRVSANEP